VNNKKEKVSGEFQLTKNEKRLSTPKLLQNKNSDFLPVE